MDYISRNHKAQFLFDNVLVSLGETHSLYSQEYRCSKKKGFSVLWVPVYSLGMTQFILSPKSLDYLNLRSIYFINSPHLVYVSRQSQLFVVLFSCQVEDMSSDNLPDLHGSNFSLPSLMPPLVINQPGCLQAVKGKAHLVEVIYQLLACCCHVNDRGTIQDGNRNSGSRQDLTASGKRRWFPFLPLKPGDDLSVSVSSKDIFLVVQRVPQ